MPSDRPSLTFEELYSAALSLPYEQQQGYVMSHCADPAMRDELLLRLVDAAQTIAAVDAPRPPSAGQGKNTAPSLTAGTRLGHYRIQRAIGSGGMGFVYEALDEDLNRAVAVKVLPLGCYDEMSRKRFRREAEAASALNHPNIVTVHEVGREGEIDFIAMERVSGQTLNRVGGGRPMALKKAISIAAQIADALAAAHEAGIVHRDLKPANVMVSERGMVKVLDFGLAKQVTGPGASDLSRLGEVVGTPYYMSPEQAEGKSVDARSDIFAFGTLLYEMLTGIRPFQGASDVATLIAVGSAEPESLRKVRPETPKLLESIVEKCIRKQPYERWQSLSDVKLMLQDLAADLDLGGTAQQAPAAGQAHSDRLKYALAGAAGLAAGLLLTSGWWQAPAPTHAPATVRLVTAERGLSKAPALSRDGSLLTFASDRAGEGNLDLWLQQVGGSEPIRLTSDPADETDPSFSPDGSRIAYRSEKDGGGIFVIPALGGDPVLIAPKGRNPRFSPDSRSMAFWIGREGSSVPGASKIFVVDLAGGTPREIKTGIAWAQFPVWSPDGKSLLLFGAAGGRGASADWWIVAKAGGKAKSVGISPMLRPWRSRVALDRVAPIALDWHREADRSYVLFAPDIGDISNLWRVSVKEDGHLAGAPEPVTHGPGRQLQASLTRNKEGLTRLAYADETVNYDIWKLPVHAGTGLANGPLRAVTDRLTPEMNPSIDSEGKRAYFISLRLGVWSLVRKDLETGRERVLYSAPQFMFNARVAAEGTKLFFATLPGDLVAVPVDGGVIEKLCERCGSVTGVSRQGDRVLIEPVTDEDLTMFDVASRKLVKLSGRGSTNTLLSGGQFSPDGKSVAFQALNSETRETAAYVIPISGALPVPREQWIPISGDDELSRDPVWAPDGPFLYFTSEKDGFRCIWARRLDPRTGAPQGDSFAVQHFHNTRLALRNRAGSGNIIGLSSGGGHLVFALTETTGNIWLEESQSVE